MVTVHSERSGVSIQALFSETGTLFFAFEQFEFLLPLSIFVTGEYYISVIHFTTSHGFHELCFLLDEDTMDVLEFV